MLLDTNDSLANSQTTSDKSQAYVLWQFSCVGNYIPVDKSRFKCVIIFICSKTISTKSHPVFSTRFETKNFLNLCDLQRIVKFESFKVQCHDINMSDPL